MQGFVALSVFPKVGCHQVPVRADTAGHAWGSPAGAHAEEVINLFALAVRFGIAAKELRQMIYAYPTSASDVPHML